METMERVDSVRTEERPVQWATGLKAALAIAAIFWLVSRGIPWAASGAVSPTVMGREIKDPGAINSAFSAAAIALHFISALFYSAIMMPIIHRFVYGNAVLVGAGLGVLLYLVNLAVSAMVGGAPYSRELPALITHLAFGIVFTGAYKGLVKRRVMLEP